MTEDLWKMGKMGKREIMGEGKQGNYQKGSITWKGKNRRSEILRKIMKIHKSTIAIVQSVKMKTRDGRTTMATSTINLNLKGRMDQDEGKIVKLRN
jgi:hypothetical protein